MSARFIARSASVRRLGKGFTLIELMIVVAIIGILAAIAYPNYMEYVRKGNRADARAVLLETSQFMERYYTQNSNYTDAQLPAASTTSPKGATTGIKYNISFDGTNTATSFTLQAVPTGSMTGDSCGTFTITNTGAQSAGAAGCWGN